MKRIPRAIYFTAREIEETIRKLENDALVLHPDSDEHRNIMKHIAKLRIYAEAKRWLSPYGGNDLAKG